MFLLFVGSHALLTDLSKYAVHVFNKYLTCHFVMVPLNMTYLHCLQHSLFEHLFNLYCYVPGLNKQQAVVIFPVAHPGFDLRGGCGLCQPGGGGIDNH